MCSLTLQNVVVSTITPFEKQDHAARIYPSAYFDLMVINLYVPIVFFYKPQEEHPGSFKLVDLLKSSLSKVLVPYFPFAGRWVRSSDPKVRVLQCSDDGVPFIEASIDAEMDSVLNLENFVSSIEILGGFQLMGLKTFSAIHDIDILPSLFVQATQFKCGGVALHVSFGHGTADGQGMLTFMKAWSEIALHGETSIVPSHDRSLVSSPVLYVDDDSNTGTKDICEPREDKSIFLLPVIVEQVTPPSEQLAIHKTLYVKRDVVENLKREAAEQNMEVTTVDLITAHYWRSISNLPESIDGTTSSSISTAVDGRRRFHNPPLPEHYSGNASLGAQIPQLSASELSTNALLFVADVVHKAVRAINPTTWEDFGVKFDKVNCRQISITSWFRFPMYEVIFSNNFGKPVFASSNYSHVIAVAPMTGVGFLFPPPPKLSKDVIATFLLIVDKRHAHALLGDDEFLSLFHRF